ncbi:hypothetical protein LCGC14_0414720 [marine sediment metagenome]|uniref:Uncharacterized protein n=1 Tax=marine sediment metagenome TaxID=412755 RepID=A0A0F9TAR4_9ZZZZ
MAKKTTVKKPSARAAARHDPVEDAKMEVDNEELPEQPESPAEAEATPVEPEPTPEAETPPEEAPEPGEPPPKNIEPAVRLPLYEVVETGYAQFGGMRHRLKAGKRLDSESYGEKQIQSIREQGVKLREIDR